MTRLLLRPASRTLALAVSAPWILGSATAEAQTASAANPAGRATASEIAPGSTSAIQQFAWNEGTLYRLSAAPGRVSDIALQPGETVTSVAAGDTARWIIGDTTSGADENLRSHILVKPAALGLRTNLVIATNRRVYHIEISSRSGAAVTAVSWIYPQDELIAFRRAAVAAETARPVADAIDLEALNFGYSVEGGDPVWRPLRAFDDGRQVFIEFPPLLAAGEAPPLFVTGPEGAAELVNYRKQGRYYVVDRLFAAAELRLGQDKQKIVKILKAAPGTPRRRGKRS